MRPCEHFEPELSAFLDGELPPVEHGAVGAHVEACPACARELERLRAVGVVLRRWDAEETRYATTHAFRNRVLARVRSDGVPTPAQAPRAPAGRLLIARAAAAAIVLVAAGAAGALVWPGGRDGDLARLEREIAALRRSSIAVEPSVASGPSDPVALEPPPVARVGTWEPVVTPIEDTGGVPSETVGAPEVWEEHGSNRILQDAFPAYDGFHRAQRDAQLLEELRRARATAVAPDERPTTDEGPRTPLGRFLGTLAVANGTYAPYQRVQVWPVVRTNAGSELLRDAPLTADEALALKVLRVQEGDGALVIENRDRRGRPVLLLAGDVFHGARHDRVATEDVLLDPGQKRSVRALTTGESRRIPRRSYSRSDGLAPHRVRALLARGAGQPALDRMVEASLPSLGAAGGDGSLASIFDNDQLFSRADRYVRALMPRLEREQVVGFAVAAGGDLLGVEVFSDHATFAAMSTRTLRSYVLEALARPRLVGEPPARADVVAALRHAVDAADSGTSGEVAAFLDLDAALGGYGLVKDGSVSHAVVFTGDHVDPSGIGSGRLRGAFGDAPVTPDGLDGEPVTGPARGDADTGGGLGTGR